MRFKGNLVITDPCYIKSSPSLATLQERDTIYGDWSCMVYPGKLEECNLPKEWDEKYFDFFNKYNFSGLNDAEKRNLYETFAEFKETWKKNILGEFCADSGMVGLFDYDLLSEQDKEFVNTKTLCATIIKDFDGDVDIQEINNYVHVIGVGNKQFFSTQSGL